MTTRYVYTLSSSDDPIDNMVDQAIHSIRTLTRWVDPADVVVFFTPPRYEEDLERIDALGVDVRDVPQKTERFQISALQTPSAYGEKIHLCTVDADTVVFLDCDTLVLGDITSVLDGDFQFKARRSPVTPPADAWHAVFESRDETPLDFLPNAGFLVFKDGVHADVQDGWIEHLADDFPEFDETAVNVREQWALALAVSDYDCVEMTSREHVIEWDEPVRPDGVVHHLDTTPVVSLEDYLDSPLTDQTQLDEVDK